MKPKPRHKELIYLLNQEYDHINSQDNPNISWIHTITIDSHQISRYRTPLLTQS